MLEEGAGQHSSTTVYWCFEISTLATLLYRSYHGSVCRKLNHPDPYKAGAEFPEWSASSEAP